MRKITIEELNPELFTWELYNTAGLWELDDALYAADSFGICDASRLSVRPRTGMFALMIEWPNGSKYWCHVTPELLRHLEKRLQRVGTTESEVPNV